jgi:hypothetical protein
LTGFRQVAYSSSTEFLGSNAKRLPLLLLLLRLLRLLFGTRSGEHLQREREPDLKPAQQKFCRPVASLKRKSRPVFIFAPGIKLLQWITEIWKS